MEIGASTSCFYPLETEKALDKVISLDFKTAEVFFNSPCELEEPFVKQMRKNADAGGTKIVSIHPFSSNLENNCIFGEYQRRYDDFIGMYQKHFHAAAVQTLPLSTARLPSKSDRSPRNIILSVLPLLLTWAGARVSESVRKMLSISAHRISTF